MSNSISVSVKRVNPIQNPKNATRAMVWVTLGDILVKNFTLVERKDGTGMFLKEPSNYSPKAGRFFENVIFPEGSTYKVTLEAEALKAWDELNTA